MPKTHTDVNVYGFDGFMDVPNSKKLNYYYSY